MAGIREVDVQELFRLWHSPLTNTELCEHFRVTGGSLWSLRKKYGLPIRPRVANRDTGRRPEDPTQKQIAERAAECRARRKKEDRARTEKVGCVDWQMPSYAFNVRNFSFSETPH